MPLIAATRVYTCTELFILIPSASFPRILNKLTPCFKQMSSVLVIYFDDEITSFLRKFKRKFVKAKGIHSSEDPTALILPVGSDCQLHDNIIAIGVSTRAYRVGHADETPPPPHFKQTLHVCQFYKAVTSNICWQTQTTPWFPWQSDVH